MCRHVARGSLFTFWRWDTSAWDSGCSHHGCCLVRAVAFRTIWSKWIPAIKRWRFNFWVVIGSGKQLGDKLMRQTFCERQPLLPSSVKNHGGMHIANHHLYAQILGVSGHTWTQS